MRYVVLSASDTLYSFLEKSIPKNPLLKNVNAKITFDGVYTNLAQNKKLDTFIKNYSKIPDGKDIDELIDTIVNGLSKHFNMTKKAFLKRLDHDRRKFEAESTITKDSNIKDYIETRFPKLADYVKDNYTFTDLYNDMLKGYDIYEVVSKDPTAISEIEIKFSELFFNNNIKSNEFRNKCRKLHEARLEQEQNKEQKEIDNGKYDYKVGSTIILKGKKVKLISKGKIDIKYASKYSKQPYDLDCALAYAYREAKKALKPFIVHTSNSYDNFIYAVRSLKRFDYDYSCNGYDGKHISGCCIVTPKGEYFEFKG